MRQLIASQADLYHCPLASLSFVIAWASSHCGASETVIADLIAIGALNLDYVVARTEQNEGILGDVELERERLVDEDRITRRREHLGRTNSKIEVALGGSAFNVAQVLARTASGIAIEFVGVAGSCPESGLDFVEDARVLEIGTEFVKRTSESCGLCLSVTNGDARGLETWPGANSMMADHINERHEELLYAISRAKLVHVTSFFDDETPAALLRLLGDAHRRFPWVRISFDPGHYWCGNLRAFVIQVAGICDYLFLNEQEFARLQSDDITRQAIRSLLTEIGPNKLLILIKRFNQICTASLVRGQLILRTLPQKSLPPEQIVNPTGAGDVFAAGFLAAALTTNLDSSHGVLLGMRMARQRLICPQGDLGDISFGNEYISLIKDVETGSADLIPIRTIRSGRTLGLAWLALGRRANLLLWPSLCWAVAWVPKYVRHVGAMLKGFRWLRGLGQKS